MMRHLIFASVLSGLICLPSQGKAENCEEGSEPMPFEVAEGICSPPLKVLDCVCPTPFEPSCDDPCCFLEVDSRVGYRFVTAEKTKKMFPKGWFEYQFEGAYYFDRMWSFFANVGYGYKRGHSVGLHDRTSIWMVPVSIGAAFNLFLPYKFEFRLGGGVTYAYLDTKNHTRSVPKHVSTGGGGGVIKTDLLMPFNHFYFAGIFADYSFLYFPENKSEGHIHKRSFDASGVVAGVFAGLNF
jgi:hypothetical protein